MNNPTKDESIIIAAAMIEHGGGFVIALGKALQYADSENVRRIKDAFPEYWNRYAELAKMDV